MGNDWVHNGYRLGTNNPSWEKSRCRETSIKKKTAQNECCLHNSSAPPCKSFVRYCCSEGVADIVCGDIIGMEKILRPSQRCTRMVVCSSRISDTSCRS